jgi:3-oxoacyl-[acyl-carrier-protein] synthase-3
MAFFELRNIAIKGISAALPNKKVSTFDIDLFTREEAQTFIDTVGIENRYWVSSEECASDLCLAAAEKLLADLQWDKNTINILAFDSVTRDYRTPPTACILQDRLSLPETCFTLDIPMGCCGLMYGMVVLGRILSAENKRALLLVGDTASRMSSPKDKSRVPLFGDCGTAIALEYDEDAETICVDINTDGSGYKALLTPHSEFRHQVTPESFEYEDFGNGIVRAPVHSLINGMDVFMFAITKPPKNLMAMMERLQLEDKDVDYYLVHQANKIIVDRFAKKSKINPEKMPMNIRDYGNCGGASIPLLMVTELAEQLRNGSLSLVMSSFGLGLTWGTMYMKTKPMVVSKIVNV